MKSARQTVILDILSSQNIETQQQLREALSARGVHSTQATLSRDIRDMRLVKVPGADGRSHYALPPESESDDSHIRLRKIMREGVRSFDVAQNLLVIKTLPGLASAVCSAIDGMGLEELVGSIAGDDTAFLALRSSEAAEKLYREIRENF